MLLRNGPIFIFQDHQVLESKKWLPTLDALRSFDWGKLARDMQTVRGILGLEPTYG